jgi:hypothetical protein
MTKKVLLFSLLLLMNVPRPLLAASLNCSGGIVSVDDSRADLLMKCGEPDAKESHEEELVSRLDDGTKQKLFITVEEWTYNFGPSQFMRIVALRNGKVAFIRTGNYGYTREAKPAKGDCSEQVVSVGDTKSDVLAKCGEPAWKDTHEEAFQERLDSGLERRVYVIVDEWTYNLGPDRFVRILTFRNGKLADIRTGGYGYQRKDR